MSENKNIENPLAESVKASLVIKGVPEVVHVSFDLWQLMITLEFTENNIPVYIRIESVRGFRVLDEGDLLEFWNKKARPDGWLWKINKGGWLDLESTRKGFISGYHKEDSFEYLILGVNYCVSVVTTAEPEIINPVP